MQNTGDIEWSDELEVAGGLGYNSGRTPLDKTIDRIGMGSYQWMLLFLCGFGWMADNMWIQAITIILPRVQQHYSVPDNCIGALSSSMYAGMMVGAVGWGTCSDVVGRSVPFNGTLFFTALFGIIAPFASSFLGLCLSLFFLGSAVGGSMPTDGMLVFEHMPNEKQYLVTALSVFFSLGSVLSALVALFILPGHSCSLNQPCSPSTENTGWQHVLVCLGLITLLMFLARVLLFRLHESPRYLVHAGRHQDALNSLKFICRFNGVDVNIDPTDIHDRRPCTIITPSSGSDEYSTPFPATQEVRPNHSDPLRTRGVNYQSTHHLSRSLDSRSFEMSVSEYPTPQYAVISIEDSPSSSLPNALLDETMCYSTPSRLPYPASQPSVSPAPSIVSVGLKTRFGGVLLRRIEQPFMAWLDRIGTVLDPKWRAITFLVWAVWIFMAVANTMFNVYYPKLLETRLREDLTSLESLQDNLWDVIIFMLGGCPGPLLGAYMVKSALGRRWSLAGTTILTAFFCMIFTLAETPLLVRVSSVGINLSATTVYAVLYGWTPELFDAKVRGTACGTASGLSRIGGMVAPLLGGALLSINRSLPVYASMVVYLVTVLIILCLRERPEDREGGELHLTH